MTDISKNTDSKEKVVTRFAPSPTGLLHLGNYRTAVFSYFYARQNGGKFVLRIEDTDKERSKKEYEDNILESLTWLGIKHDEFYRQSERSDIYKGYLEQLIKEGKAYISKETPKEPGGRTEVIRLKNANKKVKFHDLIRGDIETDTTDLGDFIIAKSITEPVFHFAVVIDDFTMGVTHIVRGEDHISNTPRHILIYEALGAQYPQYAHLPLVLAPDRSKLSKRRGAVAATEYRSKGYLPEALVNYMALLGWNPGTEQEIFSFDELIKTFDLTKVQKGGAVFDDKKLRWVNKEHIREISDEGFLEICSEHITKSARALEHSWNKIDLVVKKAKGVLRDRLETFGDLDDMITNGELDYFFEMPQLKAELLLWKNQTDLKVVAEILNKTKDEVIKLPESVTKEDAKALIMPFAEKIGRGEVLWPLRVSLSGREKSPDPFTLIEVLGTAESLRRIDHALALIK